MNTLQDLTQAYERGKQDRRDGKMLNANPYTDHELQEMWRAGWNDEYPRVANK